MDTSFLKWIEHAGFLLEIGGKKVYIDPFRIRGKLPKADIVFITHTHFDHLNEEALGKISDSRTRFVAPRETAGKLSGRNVLEVEPNRDYEIEGIKFHTVPAYNTDKEFHPKVNGWVGYIIDADGTKVYHPGDTDETEELKKVRADIALLPIGGHYVMNVEEAIDAAGHIKAKLFIPMHYRALLGPEGSKKAEEEFRKRVKNSLILDQVQEPYYSFQ
ncbi:MAG: MBL fold metallo-hydrolase [Candidatus Micrarchaeota archaeon]|nr:MBL fold metallo-hydrolase [Candidatus Micrarchaeota archaeon]